MASQNFVSNLGLGLKGYSIISVNSKYKSCIVTGRNSSIVKTQERINRILGETVSLYKVGVERNSLLEAEKFSSEFKSIGINRIFVIGGGSIIDFAKRIAFFLVEEESPVELIVIPSVIGSGAESSMTSILNTNSEKSIKVDQNMIPASVIYDFDLYQTLTSRTLFEGSVDAITHLIESSLSFLSNEYVNFLSYSALKRFFSYVDKNDVSFENPSKEFILELCLLSFNGGTAQNNAGSGLCHALSHATESLFNQRHAAAITEFLRPTISIQIKSNLLNLNAFPDSLEKRIENYYGKYSGQFGIPQMKNTIIGNEDKVIDLLNKATEDPCWKLMKKKIKKDTLSKEITKYYDAN